MSSGKIFGRGLLMVGLIGWLGASGCAEDDAPSGVDAGADAGIAPVRADATDEGGVGGDAGGAVDTGGAEIAEAGAAETGAGGDASAAACPAKPAEAECEPVATETIPLSAPRTRHCAFDIGSTNVKLVVASRIAGQVGSFDGDRVCKKAMRLRDKTQDPATMMNRPLSEADMDALVAQLETYAALCTRDGGQIVGAVATQWARNATNPDEMKAWFTAKMAKVKPGLELDVLSGDREGAYGYGAATEGALDRVIIDVGGGSFQIAYWVTGEAKPISASVAFGHEAAHAKVWSRPEHTSYAAARAAYVSELEALVAAKPETAAAYARLDELVRGGKLHAELVSLGDSGVILAVEGKLQDAGGNFVDQTGYLAALEQRRRELAASTVTGPKKTLSIQAADAFLERIAANPAWFEQLRSECIAKAYGAKVLGYLTLVSHLAKRHALADRVIFKSGEMAEGYLLEKLH